VLVTLRCSLANENGAWTTCAAAAPTYARHVSERTLLYGLVKAHYPDLMARLAAQDRSLPAYVREEFEAFLRSGARRMAESARHLVEEVFGPRPVRQRVLSVPVPLRLLFALRPPVPLNATRNASSDAFAGRCFPATRPPLPQRNGFAIACAGISRKQALAKAQAAPLTI